MELLAAKSIGFNGKKNQLSVLFCLLSQVEMELFISLSHTHTHTQLLTCDVDAVGALTPHRPAVVAPRARPPLVTVALPPCGGDKRRHFDAAVRSGGQNT